MTEVWYERNRWKYFGRHLFVYQTLFLFAFGTAACHMLSLLTKNIFFVRTTQQNIASAADVPINTMLAFMFGIVVSRSIVGRYDLGNAVVKAHDFAMIVNWTWKSNYDASCYRNVTMQCIEEIRKITTDAFADQVLFPGFRGLHDICVARDTNLVKTKHAILNLRCREMDIFTNLCVSDKKPINHFQGYAMCNPLSRLYHTATSADSCFETRFAVIALSICSVLSRHAIDSSDSYNGTIAWASVIFFVVLLPYSLIASFAYKKSAWLKEENYACSIINGKDAFIASNIFMCNDNAF